MRKENRIALEAETRQWLERWVKIGVRSAQSQRRARILLWADENAEHGGWSDAKIAGVLEISVLTVERARREYRRCGRESLLRKPRLKGPRERKLDARQEAQLVALCCEPPPQGNARWSLRLLADKLVELQVVEAISHETVRQVLHSNKLKPWQKKHWCLPPREQRRVRLCHGRCAGSLSSAVKSSSPTCLPG